MGPQLHGRHFETPSFSGNPFFTPRKNRQFTETMGKMRSYWPAAAQPWETFLDPSELRDLKMEF